MNENVQTAIQMMAESVNTLLTEMKNQPVPKNDDLKIFINRLNNLIMEQKRFEGIWNNFTYIDENPEDLADMFYDNITDMTDSIEMQVFEKTIDAVKNATDLSIEDI